ncbi:MAG: hypothetical protein M0R80_03295 [Proteobacteria bacterium]|jgi:hypothetical protein|nr:hypothetical protein [Pseudomonadota bacterium]
MGAASVTGVGQGVASNLKGPGNNRNFNVPQNSPHIVAAGIVTTDGGTGLATVTFPDALPLAAASYAVILTARGAGAATHNASLTTKSDTSSHFTSFVVYAETPGDVVEWIVVNTGWGLDLHHTV